MTPEASGLVPYHPHRHHPRSRRLSVAVDSWITVSICVLAGLAGVLVGATQRDPRPVALTCYSPPPAMAVSTAAPVAMLCTGEVAR